MPVRMRATGSVPLGLIGQPAAARADCAAPGVPGDPQLADHALAVDELGNYIAAAALLLVTFPGGVLNAVLRQHLALTCDPYIRVSPERQGWSLPLWTTDESQGVRRGSFGGVGWFLCLWWRLVGL